MADAIPKEWRREVAAILREGCQCKVLIRRRARLDWAATFPNAFEYELREAMAAALEIKGVQGTRHYMDEPGVTYAFMFINDNRQLYGKINLTEPDHIIIVYSAHIPLQGDEII